MCSNNNYLITHMWGATKEFRYYTRTFLGTTINIFVRDAWRQFIRCFFLSTPLGLTAIGVSWSLFSFERHIGTDDNRVRLECALRGLSHIKLFETI